MSRVLISRTEAMSYDANDALNEIEDALSELERVAEDLINNPNKESELRGQGIHQAAKHLRFRIRNIRRGEAI